LVLAECWCAVGREQRKRRTFSVLFVASVQSSARNVGKVFIDLRPRALIRFRHGRSRRRTTYSYLHCGQLCTCRTIHFGSIRTFVPTTSMNLQRIVLGAVILSGLMTGNLLSQPTAVIKIDLDRKIGEVDPKIYGGFLEPIRTVVYGTIYDPKSPLADTNGFRKDFIQ